MSVESRLFRPFRAWSLPVQHPRLALLVCILAPLFGLVVCYIHSA